MAGLCVSLRDARLEHVRPARLARIAIVALMTIQVAFLAFGYAAVAWASLPLLGILVVLLLSRGTGAVEITQAVAVTALAAASSHFMYAYADYSYVHRVRFVPATAILLALRFTYAAGALAAMIGVALAARSAVDRWRPGRVALVTAITVVALQLAYFFIDYFVDYRVRFIQAIVILAAAVFGAALLAKSAAAARPMLAQLTVTAVLGLASVQFAYFYVDYFTRYRDRSGNFEPEGNARVAWETLIERTRHRSVPAIYLSNVGPYGFSDLYWTFYTIKHHREDLLARTTSDVAFEPDRVRRLPDASLVVTSPSPGTDDAIARMLSAGDLRDRTLVTAPDGATRFWILETAARRSVAAR